MTASRMLAVALIVFTVAKSVTAQSCDPNTNYQCATGSDTDPGPRLCSNLSAFEDSARQRLFGNGIKVNLCPCPQGTTFDDVASGKVHCTEVGALLSSTIDRLVEFKNEAQLPLVVSGGTEPGHTGVDPGDEACNPYRHDNGFKVDVQPVLPLAAFIIATATSGHFFQIGNRPNGDPLYGVSPDVGSCVTPIPNGPIFAFETSKNHWDVVFPPNSNAFMGLNVDGAGRGQISSTLPSLNQCVEPCGFISVTRGMLVDLSPLADSSSIFDGWEGLTGAFDSLNGSRALVFADGLRNITAVFDVATGGGQSPAIPPGAGPGSWVWNPGLNGGMGGWVWTGTTTPPKGPQPPGCGWQWDPTLGNGAWLHTICLPCRQFGLSACISGGSLTETTVTSRDPNEKVGLHGAGVDGYLSGSQPLSYSIFFDNQPIATAPAQSVTVTDSLAANLDDLSTLTLGPISFGGRLITPPAIALSQGGFNTSVDLRPTENLIVNIASSIDTSSGILSWTFLSLDPVTGQPTSDPLLGLLPPGAEGSVSFTVAKAATGVPINNKATVVFDKNAPLDTEIWTNTIDTISPVSSVQPLSASEPASGFTLTWSGTDVGSGVQDFTIFVSDNSGPFTPFQTNTTATSATFTGQVGHTYGFYSIARDLVGNVEANKIIAEATTLVVLATDSIPPTTSVLAAPSPNAAGWNNSNVTVSLNSADDPGGTGVKQIGYSATGAQPIASTTVTSATTSFQIANEGITTIAFFGTDNSGNVETPKALTVELDKTPPSIIGSRAPLPNANGWSNTGVTVSFACVDALSGLAPGSPPANTVVATEGAHQSVSGACQDLAGNIALAAVSGINIDKTAPTLSGMPAAGCTLSATGKLIQIAVVSGADALSGLASFDVSASSSQAGDDANEPDIVVTGSGVQSRTLQVRAKIQKGAASRTYTINATAVDAAGNAVNSSSTCIVTNGH